MSYTAMSQTMQSQSLLDALRESLVRCGLTGSTVIVAVSGGPDSLALALAISDLRSELGLDPRFAHLDHQLRSNSGAEAELVREIGRKLGIPVAVGRADVRQTAARERLGLEDAARRERYRFLAELSRSERAAAVLVAHTADDQTETRLLHWLRGAGLRGLAGMTEDRMLVIPGAGRLRVVRPLLGIRHADTERFCAERGVEPVHDPSNLDRTFTRNRLRHDILPALRSLNPRLDDSLARLARCAADAADFIETELDRRLPDLATISDAEWRIQRAAWRTLPAALKRATLQRAAEALAGRVDVLDAANVEDAIEAASTWSAGRVLAWPAGLEVRVEHESVLVRRSQHPTRTARPAEVRITAEGPVELAGVVLRVERRASRCRERDGDPNHCDLDAAVVGGIAGLVLRTRRPGDWLLPTGLGGRKKLQDVFVDARVPAEERDRVPIVVAPGGIAWVVGLRRDQRFLAGPGSQDVICLSVENPRPVARPITLLTATGACEEARCGI